jgi:hypothetical protein
MGGLYIQGNTGLPYIIVTEYQNVSWGMSGNGDIRDACLILLGTRAASRVRV